MLFLKIGNPRILFMVIHIIDMATTQTLCESKSMAYKYTRWGSVAINAIGDSTLRVKSNSDNFLKNCNC